MSFERKPIMQDLLACTWSCEPYTEDEKTRMRTVGMGWALNRDITDEDGRWANFRAMARQELAHLEAVHAQVAAEERPR